MTVTLERPPAATPEPPAAGHAEPVTCVVDQGALERALRAAAGVVPERTTVDALTCVRLRLPGWHAGAPRWLEVEANDLQTALRLRVPLEDAPWGTEGAGAMAWLVPGRFLADLVATAPPGPLVLEGTPGWDLLRLQAARPNDAPDGAGWRRTWAATVLGVPVEEFPPVPPGIALPDPPDAPLEDAVRLLPWQLAALHDLVALAADHRRTRPVLENVRLRHDPDGGGLVAEAADGFRLSRWETGVHVPAGAAAGRDPDWLVPAGSVRVLRRLVGRGTQGTVALRAVRTAGDGPPNALVVTLSPDAVPDAPAGWGPVDAIVRLAVGVFPDLRQVADVPARTTIDADRPGLQGAARAAGLFLRSPDADHFPVWLSARAPLPVPGRPPGEPALIECRCQEATAGAHECRIDGTVTGTGQVLLLNYAYVAAIAATLAHYPPPAPGGAPAPGDVLRLEAGAPGQPVRVLRPGLPGFRHVIMVMAGSGEPLPGEPRAPGERVVSRAEPEPAAG